MSIEYKKIYIKNFTVFKEEHLNFSKGINFINKSTNQVIQNIEANSEDECSYEIGFPDKEQKALFIPAKEMLSHSKGFLALNNKYDMPFDKTYIDSITNAELPEANINPELIPVIVDMPITLQRDGVQVFVATYSYNFSKYFEIKKSSEDRVIYHNLYKTNDGIKSESKEYFGELKNNSIIEADSKLLDEVVEGSLME